jgi:hypothetical protein
LLAASELEHLDHISFSSAFAEKGQPQDGKAVAITKIADSWNEFCSSSLYFLKCVDVLCGVGKPDHCCILLTYAQYSVLKNLNVLLNCPRMELGLLTLALMWLENSRLLTKVTPRSFSAEVWYYYVKLLNITSFYVKLLYAQILIFYIRYCHFVVSLYFCANFYLLFFLHLS